MSRVVTTCSSPFPAPLLLCAPVPGPTSLVPLPDLGCDRVGALDRDRVRVRVRDNVRAPDRGGAGEQECRGEWKELAAAGARSGGGPCAAPPPITVTDTVTVRVAVTVAVTGTVTDTDASPGGRAHVFTSSLFTSSPDGRGDALTPLYVVLDDWKSGSSSWGLGGLGEKGNGPPSPTPPKPGAVPPPKQGGERCGSPITSEVSKTVCEWGRHTVSLRFEPERLRGNKPGSQGWAVAGASPPP